MTPHKLSILYLCTGTASRSQMAEALTNLHYGDRVDAVSAGSRPAGFVHPLAVAAIEEAGGTLAGAYSKHADAFVERPFDVVVTVCDSAARDCPSWPGARRIEHWPVEDPSFGPDDPATRPQRFRTTRDELKARIDELMKTI